MEFILQDILRGLFTYRIWIFILLGIGFLLYLLKFIQGLKEWKKAVFGLEQNIVQRKIITSSTGLILIFLLLLGEFLVVTIIAPQMPAKQVGASEEEMINQLPVDINLAEDSQNLDVNDNQPQDKVDLDFECIEGVVDIVFPANGDSISGTIEVIGSVNVDNFGSYKYEYSPTTNTSWVTIAAGNQLKLKESIGYWHTGDLMPGAYFLRLAPLDNTGEELKPCIVTVDILSESEE